MLGYGLLAPRDSAQASSTESGAPSAQSVSQASGASQASSVTLKTGSTDVSQAESVESGDTSQPAAVAAKAATDTSNATEASSSESSVAVSGSNSATTYSAEDPSEPAADTETDATSTEALDPTEPDTETPADTNNTVAVIPKGEKTTVTPTDPENIGENTSNISTVITPIQKTVSSGNDSDFNLTFKITGPKFKLTNAKLVVQLPDQVGVTFDQNLNKLKIAGVVPVYDIKKMTLTYNFKTLKSGSFKNLILPLHTKKGVLPNGTVLTVTAKLTADELSTAATATAHSSITANKTSSITNKIVSVESADPENADHTNPAQNDTAVWGVGITLLTSQNGQVALQPGSDLVVTYKPAKGLTYKGLQSGEGLNMTTPTVTTNSDGSTTLTWTFRAPDIDTQTASDINYRFNVITTVNDDVISYTTLTNTAGYQATYYDGVTGGRTIDAKVQVAPADQSRIPDSVGSAYATSHRGPIDGAGNYQQTGKVDSNKTFYVEDDPTLGYQVILTSTVATSATRNFDLYTMHYFLDPHLNFTGFTTGEFYFRPDSSFTNYLPLTERPYMTLAVDYGDGVYHILDSEVTANETFTQQQLVDKGLDTSQTIKEILLFFHKQGSDTLPDDVDHPTESSWAPAGLYGSVKILAQPDEGYIGQVQNKMYTTFWGVDSKNNARYAYDLDDWDRYPGFAAYFMPQTSQIVHAPQGVNRVVTGQVGFTDTNSGEQVILGDHQVGVKVNLTSTSLDVLTQLHGDFEGYVLLPKGVEYDAETSIPSTAYTTSLVTDDYNGTGESLVKIVWQTKYVTTTTGISAAFGTKVTSEAAHVIDMNLVAFLGSQEYTVPGISGDSQITDTTLTTDKSDLNSNSQTDENVIETGAEYIIANSTELQVTGEVSGDKEATWHQTVTVSPDSVATIHLNTTENTDETINQLYAIDELPTLGDLGITDSTDRDSNFVVSLDGPITLPSDWEGKVTVEYTTTQLPSVKGSLDGETVYPDGVTQLENAAESADATWLAADDVTDWSSIKAFRLVMDPDSDFEIAGQNQTISFKVKVPGLDSLSGIDSPQAWNTFAMAVNASQAVEPEEVGIFVTDEAAPVKVIYQTEDGTILESGLANYPADAKYGDAYTTTQKGFSGYTFVKMGDNSAPANGTLSGDEQTVIYVYKKVDNGGGTTTPPEVPETPEVPGNPGNPGDPGTPETPTEPETPSNPSEPANPETPGNGSDGNSASNGSQDATVGTSVTNPTQQNESDNAAQLPQTNEKASVNGLAGIIMLVLTAILGLFGIKKKRS